MRNLRRVLCLILASLLFALSGAAVASGSETNRETEIRLLVLRVNFDENADGRNDRDRRRADGARDDLL
ncbi:MAG: hypothetical protein II797_05285, partial [Clostridia bacterium]|nr:hypothetical protein [Clostridia bacterium]